MTTVQFLNDHVMCTGQYPLYCPYQPLHLTLQVLQLAESQLDLSLPISDEISVCQFVL